MKENDKIISFLLEEEVLTQNQVNELLIKHQQSGISLLNLVRDENILQSHELTRLVAASNNIEFINLSPDSVDPIVVKLVPMEIVKEHNLIPIKVEKNNLYLAMSSPLNLAVRDMVATKTGYNIIPVAATEDAVKQVVDYFFNVQNATRQDIVAMRLKHSPKQNARAKKAKAQPSQVTDAPVVRLVDSIITGAIDARASDIHIEPQEPDMRVRYRVDGILNDALDMPGQVHKEVVSHIKILAEMDISEKRIPQDGHISITRNSKDYDLRVSSLPAVGGEKIVIRILDANTGLKNLTEVLTEPTDYQKVSNIISNPYGMILLTGPTGSGKTTTLYAILQQLNTARENIVTIEDPVEYRLKGITQVQIKPEMGRTFAKGLRSILRQDPDIIFIGEIRDEETAEIAVSAALTGHLVLSTLHTNDTVGAISRLISLKVPPFQVASSLLGVIAQRLVRKVCEKCKKQVAPTPEQLSSFGDSVKQNYIGTGCSACMETGYRKRCGVYEILPINNEIKKLINAQNADEIIREKAVAQNMITLKNKAIQLANKGVTSLDEIMRVIDMREN